MEAVRAIRRRVGAKYPALLGYMAISFAYFGWRLLPHPGRIIVAMSGQRDFEIIIWSFAWWPHAILSWTNPFYSHAVYAPIGINLAWVVSVPALAIVFSPVTLLFGPTVAYNVAALLMPAVSAWTAFLLCRYVTRSTWASLVGGYLYGFSGYVLTHEGGQLQLSAAFLLPLAALVVVGYVRNDLGARGLAWRLGLIVAFQAYCSTEIAVTLTLMLALGLILAFAVANDARPRLLSAIVPIVAAYGIAALLAAPLLYYAFTGIVPYTLGLPWDYSADPVNLIVPPVAIGWGGQTIARLFSHLHGSDTDSYLGIPTLLIAALSLLRRPWTAATRFLVAAFVVATFLSLGTALWIDGHRYFWLPWSAVSHLTGFTDIIPARLAVFATLAVAILAAMWITSARGSVFPRPVVLPLFAVAAMMPPVSTATYAQDPPRLAFFTSGVYKSCIPRDETLIIFPYARWGDSLLWQAESGFWFNMAEGTLGANNLPTSFTYNETVSKLLYQFSNPTTRPTMRDLAAFAKSHHVDRIVSTALTSDPYPNVTQMRAFGQTELVDDVYIAPGCGQPSLEAEPAP